jgi:GNAT superfamily N-acetyltransferase
MLRERLEFLRGPGGIRAAAYFGLKLLARVEAFRVVWKLVQSDALLMLPSGWRYASIHTAAALSGLSSDLLEQVAGRSGSGPGKLVGRGGSVHLLLAGDALVAQLSIERGPSCRIDTPPVVLGMAATDAWLGYLYTWPAYRRLGAARWLIAATENDLTTRNIHRLIAHIRATNVPSVATFEHSGWQPGGTILCTLSGRLLAAPGAARIGLSIR